MWRVVATLALAGGVGWGAEVLDGAVLGTMQRDFPHVLVVARTAVTEELDVAVVLGSPRAMSGSLSFSWSEDESVGLYVQERSRQGRVYVLGPFRGFSDCFARVERVTATNAVISCRGRSRRRRCSGRW